LPGVCDFINIHKPENGRIISLTID